MLETNHLIEVETQPDLFGKAAIGVGTYLVEYPLANIASNATYEIMESYGYDLSGTQDAKAIYDNVSNDGNLVSTLIKIAFVCYICIFGPILEEFIFREVFQNVTASCQENSDGIAQKVFRVFLNGLVFGACHYSPSQGWLNVPIFVATFIGGIVYATARELTGDIIAPSIGHALHNTTAVLSWNY